MSGGAVEEKQEPRVVRFVAYGVPTTEGNLATGQRRDGSRFSRHVNPKGLDAWRTTLGWAARAVAGQPFENGVVTVVRFFMQPPKSLPKTKLVRHQKRPDYDKLVRAVNDALTGILWRDDSQVFSSLVEKHYATGSTCAEVIVCGEEDFGSAIELANHLMLADQWVHDPSSARAA